MFSKKFHANQIQQYKFLEAAYQRHGTGPKQGEDINVLINCSKSKEQRSEMGWQVRA
jgi:hypothetical protein